MTEYATTFEQWQSGMKLPPANQLDALFWKSHIAGNLVRLRNNVRDRLGKRWPESFANAKQLILMAMEKNQCNELSAGLKMAEFIGRKFQGEEANQGKQMFLAAAVEMINPTL